MLNLDHLNQLLSIAAPRLQLPTFRQIVGKNGHNLDWLVKKVAPSLDPKDELARLLSMKLEDLLKSPKDAPMPERAVFSVKTQPAQAVNEIVPDTGHKPVSGDKLQQLQALRPSPSQQRNR